MRLAPIHAARRLSFVGIPDTNYARNKEIRCHSIQQDETR
jgi:hypothetical protein